MSLLAICRRLSGAAAAAALAGGIAAAWIAGAVAAVRRRRQAADRQSQPRPLACNFVAVGHGVSVLVELPDGRNLLYDAGRLGSPLAGVRPVSSVLWSRGITHLDAVVISHADADHFNATPGLLERFSVGAIYVSPVMFEELPPAVKELHERSIAAACRCAKSMAASDCRGGGA